MKVAFVIALLALIAGIEVWHELASGHGHAESGVVCTAPETQREVIREFLLHHLHRHR